MGQTDRRDITGSNSGHASVPYAGSDVGDYGGLFFQGHIRLSEPELAFNPDSKILKTALPIPSWSLNALKM
jgi:hypothetical protein